MLKNRRDPICPWPLSVICNRLTRVHGPVRPPVRLPVLDELIATILSQHTSDTNSVAAFKKLQQNFASWDDVRRARVSTIKRVIRRGGLAQQKAPRIKHVLQEIYTRHEEMSLDFLCSMSTAEALAYLRSLSGVGPKTAACVLLFSCGKPVLPVDTHVHRVSQRLGLIGPKTSAERAHDDLAERVPTKRVLEFHILLVRHGRTVCTARNPKCAKCVLLKACPEGQRTTKPRTGHSRR